MSCPFFGLSNSDLQKWSSGKVGSSGHNPHAEIQAAISREVGFSIKASMQKKLNERTTKDRKNLDVLDLALKRFAWSAGRPIAQRPLFRGRDFSISKLG